MRRVGLASTVDFQVGHLGEGDHPSSRGDAVGIGRVAGFDAGAEAETAAISVRESQRLAMRMSGLRAGEAISEIFALAASALAAVRGEKDRVAARSLSDSAPASISCWCLKARGVAPNALAVSCPCLPVGREPACCPVM